MRASRPIPAVTSVMSAPTKSLIRAISLAKLILVAKNALEAYLIISAVVSPVCSSGTTSRWPTSPGSAARESGGRPGRDLQRLRRIASQYHPIRVEIVLNGVTLPQELGIRDHVEQIAGAGSHHVLDERTEPVAGADRDRALRHDDVVVVQVLRNGERNGPDGAHVGMPVGAGRRAHADEDDVGGVNGCGELVGKAQVALGEPAFEELIQTRLVERGDARPELSELRRIRLDADDLVAHVGQAGRHHRPHIAASNYRNAFTHIEFRSILRLVSCRSLMAGCARVVRLLSADVATSALRFQAHFGSEKIPFSPLSFTNISSQCLRSCALIYSESAFIESSYVFRCTRGRTHLLEKCPLFNRYSPALALSPEMSLIN